MPSIRFLPDDLSFQIEVNTKILVAANRNKVSIRYGCAACRCGTCAVAIISSSDHSLSEMKNQERDLLHKMKLPLDGSVRLSCQARVLQGDVEVDLAFQDQYSVLSDED